jgi:hypothetical protein
MKTRIYIVTTPSGTRAISAPTRSAAIAYAADGFSARAASKDDLAAFLEQGVQVEQAKEDE